MRPEKHDSGMLETLERYRNLALEEAQSAHAQCAQALEKESATCAQLEESLESAYSVHRARANDGQALSAEAIRLAYYYARNQAVALAEARTSRDGARARTTRAQDQLAARLEQLKVIERLRENRGRGVAKWERRRAQAQLDELGIIKGCQLEGSWPSAE